MSVVLDSATEQFLAGVRAEGGKPMYEQTVDEIRAMVATVSRQLAAPTADLHDVINRRIPSAGGEIGLRIYTPRALRAGESLPLVLLFHGGGWIAGDLDTHDSIARYFAHHADAVVVAVDYRLAPEHRFPAAVDDAYAALTWAVEHASEIHGDASRVAVAGDSAGGNLAAVVCQLARARRGPSIAFQALVYPCVDLDLPAAYPSRSQFGGGEYFLSTRDMEMFRSHYLQDPASEVRDARASPIAASDLRGLPPALVVTSGCDPLRDEGKAYADRLAADGVEVEYHCFEGAIHAFMSFAAAIPMAMEGLSLVADRLRAALHPGPRSREMKR
jgi:acetyl esterase